MLSKDEVEEKKRVEGTKRGNTVEKKTCSPFLRKCL